MFFFLGALFDEDKFFFLLFHGRKAKERCFTSRATSDDCSFD